MTIRSRLHTSTLETASSTWQRMRSAAGIGECESSKQISCHIIPPLNTPVRQTVPGEPTSRRETGRVCVWFDPSNPPPPSETALQGWHDRAHPGRRFFCSPSALDLCLLLVLHLCDLCCAKPAFLWPDSASLGTVGGKQTFPPRVAWGSCPPFIDSAGSCTVLFSFLFGPSGGIPDRAMRHAM